MEDEFGRADNYVNSDSDGQNYDSDKDTRKLIKTTDLADPNPYYTHSREDDEDLDR